MADDEPSNEKAKKEEIKRFYPIGTPGQPWNDEEREQWKSQTKIQRSYKEEVVAKIEAVKASSSEFVVEQYGSLSHNPDRYPLFAIRVSASSSNSNKNVLVTGGVHGYETSGVQGALLFAKEKASHYAKLGFNIVIAPCVSPWAYENIQRWQYDIKDPNRSFVTGEKQTEESKALMEYLDKQQCEGKWICHLVGLSYLKTLLRRFCMVSTSMLILAHTLRISCLPLVSFFAGFT